MAQPRTEYLVGHVIIGRSCTAKVDPVADLS